MTTGGVSHPNYCRACGQLEDDTPMGKLKPYGPNNVPTHIGCATDMAMDRHEAWELSRDE